ncbi:MAG: hypothetical protein VX899_24465 [Myxococcota bacterium]|nr:hypothetical protein [Myxococcota bacterium]
MIIFRLDKFNQVVASRQLAVVLRALVGNSHGELLLLFNGEHVVLRRGRQGLWLDEQSLPMQYFAETAPE